MNTYEVELKRTSYTTLRVAAENENEAESLAWAQLARAGDLNEGYANWELESISDPMNIEEKTK